MLNIQKITFIAAVHWNLKTLCRDQNLFLSGTRRLAKQQQQQQQQQQPW
jgi:hypothetical protein